MVGSGGRVDGGGTIRIGLMEKPSAPEPWLVGGGGGSRGHVAGVECGENRCGIETTIGSIVHRFHEYVTDVN